MKIREQIQTSIGDNMSTAISDNQVEVIFANAATKKAKPKPKPKPKKPSKGWSGY